MDNDIKNIGKKYPKMALKGQPIELNEDWKKAMVSFLSITKINISLNGRTQTLASQLTDKFLDVFEKGQPVIETPENIEQLKIILRIKNIYTEATKLIKIINKLNLLIINNEKIVDQDLYIYYVGAKANLIQQLNETQKIIEQINTSISVSFKNLNVNVIQSEALANVHTAEEIATLIKNISESLNIDLVD